jgi:protocatechuate 3,4-dioxygenase beta subunit
MKPIAVLSLVLVAVGALVLALFSVLGGDHGRGGVVDPAAPLGAAGEAPSGELEVPTVSRTVAEPVEVRKELPQLTEEGRPATGHIRGTVLAPDGSLLERAQVALMQGELGTLSEALAYVKEQTALPPKKVVSTDSQGRFRFDGLSADQSWWLRVTHPQYAESHEPVELPEEGGTEVVVRLQTGLVLAGSVRAEATGQPIANATVSLLNLLEAHQFPPRPSTTRIETQTDGEGRFEFQNLGIGDRVLRVAATGYATATLQNLSNQIQEGVAVEPEIWRRNRTRQMNEMTAQPRPPIELDVQLLPARTIAGRALGPDRAGIEGVQIQAVYFSGEVAYIGNTVSKAGGEFLLEDLGEGIYTVRAQFPGYDSPPLPRVEAGSTDVEILLFVQASVMGRVVDAETGKPVKDFSCRVRLLHPEDITWGSVVAKQTFHDRSNGTFTLAGIPQPLQEGQQYVVEALATGYASSFSKPFQVTQGVETQNVEVQLTRGGTIKGRVVDTYAGRGVADAVVKTNENNYVDEDLMQLFNAMAQTASTRASARTGANGEFELTLLTPGRYQVVVDVPGFCKFVQNEVSVLDGAATDLGDLRLVKGAIVEGVVYDPEGTVVPGAAVTLQPSDGVDMWSGRNGRTDANGHFVLRNTKSGAYKVYAMRPPRIGANPFEGAVDMSHSSKDIEVLDGQTYQIDLHLPPVGP